MSINESSANTLALSPNGAASINQMENTAPVANQENKKHGTSYISPEGKEITFVQARDRKLDLHRDVGKMRIIMDSTRESELGGYWCEVCKCSLKDNKSWLDHINGRKHQQHLGHLVRVEHVSVDAVKEKLRSLKSETKKLSARERYLKDKLERQERARKEEEAKQQEEEAAMKEKQANEDKETPEEPAASVDPAMLEMMGFSGFGTTKKK